MVLFSDIVVKKKDTIRVYNCHFQSYKISPEEYSLTDPDKSGTRDQQVKEAKMITKKLALAFSIRAKQARTVASHIRKCPFPVIVCGDFNDTPYSYTYNILSKNLHDSFSDAGFGFSSTYNGFMNTLRIDYILFSSSMTALKYQTDHLPYSDHFPVTAVIKIP
jgi:endonuclease/exonuclease/phosphatase family metal-dependent hydrolase